MKIADFSEKEHVERLVASKKWYHKYEIYSGVVTPGRAHVDAKSILDSYGFPKKIIGKRVLEIGAWDGGYTFELESRGGEVTAMDIQNKENTGFSVAHSIKSSKVVYIQEDVTNLNPKKHGKYDIVLFLGVYYHILHPLLAFQNIYNVLKNDGLLFYNGHILDFTYNIDKRMAKHKENIVGIVDKIPISLFSRECYVGVWNNWHIPNMLCLNDWLSTAGFRVVNEKVFPQSSTMFGVAQKITNFQLCPKWEEHCWHNLSDHKDELSRFRRIVFFGAGGRFVSIQDDLRQTIHKDFIFGVADNNPEKWGDTIAGFSIINPADIPAINPDFVIITSVYVHEIWDELEDLKASQNLDFRIVNLSAHEKLDYSSGHEIY